MATELAARGSATAHHHHHHHHHTRLQIRMKSLANLTPSFLPALQRLSVNSETREVQVKRGGGRDVLRESPSCQHGCPGVRLRRC